MCYVRHSANDPDKTVMKKPALFPAHDFQMLFESVPGLYLVLTPDLRIIAVSNAYLRATMTKREDILGRKLFDIFPDNPDDPKATGERNLKSSLQRVLTHKITDAMAIQKYDIRKPESEGGAFEERYWSPVNSPVLNEHGELIYIIHRAEDVTEFVTLKQKDKEYLKENESLRIHAEQMEAEIYARAQEIAEANRELEKLYELTKKEGMAQLRAVVDHAIDGLITIDARGHIERFNPACERIFGYKAEEVTGRNIKMLMPEPYHSEHDGYLNNHLTTGKTKIIGTSGREVSGRRKDGSVFPLDLSVSSFTLDDGVHFSGILRDITARKQAEERLEMAVSELTESNQQLERFAHICSHDLQEPIRVISNYTERLAQHMASSMDEKASHYMHYIVDGAARARELIGSILTYSRVGTETEPLETIDCRDLLATVLTDLEQAIQESGARITFDTLPIITCHPPRMRQLFQNLLTNALKFRRSDVPPHVHIGAERKGDGWQFSVRDNGIGIAPEYKNRVFVIFQRLNRRDEYPGTGIGLALCKKIVEQYDGKIWLESQPGEGTCFFFTLPTLRPQEMAQTG